PTNGSSVTVTTLGNNDTYIVGVSAYNAGCGYTDTVTTTVAINSFNISVNFLPTNINQTEGIYIITNSSGIAATFQATLYKNGVEIPNGVMINGTMILPMVALLGNIDNSTEYTLVVDALLSTGCSMRIIKGAELSNNSTLKSASLQKQSSQKSVTPQFVIISPNPVLNILNVDIQKAITNPITIYVLDMNAHIITNGTFNSPNIQIDASSWSSGNYVITIQMGQEIYRQVIIKK
ncbi:MAG: T9SS type A sorting domain-containing protein, partial [Bacteroidales bacterium]|nr:T9SS type A sorting domain-containing protein [Bacteroidales bacterium]